MNKERSFIIDIITLTSVPIFSQIIGLLLTPIVTRLFSPEAFGITNLFGSICIVFGVVSTLGYHGAIILPKKDLEALKVLNLCLISLILITTFSAIIVGFGKDLIAIGFNSPQLTQLLWMLPLFVFFHGVYQTFHAWNVRLMKFGNLAKSKITEIIIKKFYQLGAGFLGLSTGYNLIIANLIGSIAKIFLLFQNINLTSIKNTFSIDIYDVAKRYRKFPMYSLWGEFISRIPAVIISFLIIKYFGNDLLGHYALSILVLSLPLSLISGSINEAFIPRVATAKHQNKHTLLLEKVYIRLVAILIFPFLIIGFFGDRLFPFVFGEQWFQAGVIAQILVFRLFIENIFSPPLALIDVMEKQELHVIKNIASTLIVLSAFSVGVNYENFYLSLWLLVLLEGLSIIILGGYMMYIVNFPFLATITKLSKYIFIGILITILAFLLTKSLMVSNNYLIGIIIISFIIYYTFLVYTDQELMSSITTAIKLITKKLFF